MFIAISIQYAGSDPRTVDNLVDGVNFTCDDLHSWLAPFSKGSDHIVVFELNEVTCLVIYQLLDLSVCGACIGCLHLNDSDMELQ